MDRSMRVSACCPTCGRKMKPVQEEPPRVVIRGTVCRVVKRTEIKKRYIPAEDGKGMLYCPPIPLLIVRPI